MTVKKDTLGDARACSHRLRFKSLITIPMIAAGVLLLFWLTYPDYEFATELQICKQIVSDVGGDSVHWYDADASPDCLAAFHDRNGLLFTVRSEKSSYANFCSNGRRKVVGVNITDPTRKDDSDCQKWRQMLMGNIFKLKRITEVGIDSTILSAQDVATLNQFQNVKKLQIGIYRAFSDYIRAISSFQQLESLEIHAWGPVTVMSSGDVKELCDMKHLSYLCLRRIIIIPGDIAVLRSSLPNCVIDLQDL